MILPFPRSFISPSHPFGLGLSETFSDILFLINLYKVSLYIFSVMNSAASHLATEDGGCKKYKGEEWARELFKDYF